MKKSKRVKRPIEDIERELGDQLQNLRRLCSDYDQGLASIGKLIAVQLRVLLHETEKSHSLLGQIGLRSGYFWDTAGKLDSRNLLCNSRLTFQQVSPSGGVFLPLVASDEPFRQPKEVLFEKWWNEPILKAVKGVIYCRRKLVLEVSNTDGGAHVDPSFNEEYQIVSRTNCLNFFHISPDPQGGPNRVREIDGRLELACIRQIAHEVLYTIHKNAPQFSDFSKPVYPDLKYPTHTRYFFADSRC